MKRKAIIISLKGKILSKNEKILLSKEKPWGVILFERNIHSLKQTQHLIYEIRKYTNNSNKLNSYPQLFVRRMLTGCIRGHEEWHQRTCIVILSCACVV